MVPSTPVEFSPEFTLLTTESPLTWDPLEDYLQFDITAEAEIETVEVEIQDTDGETFRTAVTEFGGETVEFAETYRPEKAGTHTLTVTATHGDQSENWSNTIEVDWKAPAELLFTEEYNTLLDTIDNDAQFVETVTEDNGYTDLGQRAVIFLTELANQNQDDAVALAGTLSTYEQQLTAKDLAFIEAFSESHEQYRQSLKKHKLSDSEEYDGVRVFETQLYALDGILTGDTHFQEDEDPEALREELLADFTRMRDNILTEKGYFEQTDIQYLQVVSDIISERRVARRPEYERLREESQWIQPTADGQTTESDITQLKERYWERFSANDLISDAVKEYVLNVDPQKDVVLLEVGYTDAVNFSKRKHLMQETINYMAAEYDIYIIAIEGETDTETFSSVSDWKSRTAGRLDDLDALGMHQVYFDDVALKRAAGKASIGDGPSRGIVETTHREGYVDYTLKHEMGHMFGLWGEKYSWVHAGCDSELSASYMTYCSDLSEEKFTEADLDAMREQSFEQDRTSMSRLDDWLATGTTIYEEFETFYLPESLEIQQDTGSEDSKRTASRNVVRPHS